MSRATSASSSSAATGARTEVDIESLCACLAVLAITDGRGDLARIESLVDQALLGGVRAFQIREPQVDDDALAALCTRVHPRVRDAGGLLLLNARVALVASGFADGVQLPARAPDVAAVRARLPGGAVIGGSVHDRAEIEARSGADFLVLAPVLATRRKPGVEPLGLPRARELLAATARPVVWLGGFDAVTIASIGEGAGPCGLAVLSAWSAEPAAVRARCEAIVRAAAAILRRP